MGFYTSALPILLAENGADESSLAILTLSKTIESLKIVFAPFVDTVSQPKTVETSIILLEIQ